MAYLLDSDVFIQAKNLHYGFDFCPGFWDWIDMANAAGTVISIENVRIELLGGNDDARHLGERSWPLAFRRAGRNHGPKSSGHQRLGYHQRLRPGSSVSVSTGCRLLPGRLCPRPRTYRSEP